MLKFAQKFINRSTVIGLELSNNAIHLLEAKVSKQQLHLLNANFIENAGPILTNGIVSEAHKLSSILKPLLDDCQGQQVALHLADEFIIDGQLCVENNLSAEDLEAYITLEIETRLPYPIDEAYFDFTVIGINNTEPNKNNILFAACQKSLITSRTEILHNLDFTVIFIGVEQYLMANFKKYYLEKNHLSIDLFSNNIPYYEHFKTSNFDLATALILAGLYP